MYKPLTLLAALFIISSPQAQNVGIGITTPVSKLHVRAGSDSLLLLDNSQSLQAGVTNSLHFRTGGWYNGAIKTTGETTGTGRLGFFTGTQALSNLLQERVSILNDGKVGIGTTSPVTNLQVKGSLSSPTIPGASSAATFRIAYGTSVTAALDFGRSNVAPSSSWIQAGQDGIETPIVLQPVGGNVGIATLNPTTKFQVGDYSTNDKDTYMTIKTVGGGQFKAGLGLYHYNDNYGWLLQSDETRNEFTIRHRNAAVFNNPSFTIDWFDRVGIGSTTLTSKFQVGDFGDAHDNYVTVKTAGGSLYKSGLGLYHYSDNYGWLMESDESTSKFSIRHRNGAVFNNPALTIDWYERLGIGTVNPITKLQVGDYQDGHHNYLSVVTKGGNLYKAGLGLYHYNDNYGWLLESDELQKTFAIKQKNANFNVFTINSETANFGICNDPLPHGRLRITAGAMDFGLYIEGEYSNQAALYARGRSWFDVGAKQAIINGTGNGGASTNPNAYLLEVYGGQQGISVGINSSQAHEGNNYLLFYDNGGIRGSVAAQNISELHSSWEYSFWHTLQLLSAAFIAAEAAACGLQADVWEVGVLIGETIDYIANYANEVGHMETGVGVVYQSNAADYAEWLEREDPNDQLGPGMIVGVNGGRISKHTSGSKQLMVISTAPLVLGNTPPVDRASAFEKVAFMGQVPVRVRGKVDIGDYILASGENDGIGIAVAPSKMQLEDYDKVVGVAWSSSKYSNSEFMIKTAVGLNTHDLIGEIRQQKTEVQQLKETLKGVMDYLKQKDPEFKLTMPSSQNSYAATVNSSLPVGPPLTQPKRNYSIAELNDVYEILRKKPEFVDEILKKAKEKCISRGININIESLKGFFDRETFLQEVKKAITFKAAAPKGLTPVKAEPFKLIEPAPVKN